MTEPIKAHPWASLGCPGMDSAGAGNAPCSASEWELSNAANREEKCQQVMNTLFQALVK